MGIWGQDWASYQSTQPDTSGLSFAFIKVTEGETYENPHWIDQYHWAQSQALVAGLYHYPHMGNAVSSELDHFLSTIAARIGSIPPGVPLCLDWEGYDDANKNVPKTQQLSYKEQFLRDLKARQPNSPAGMYCNADYWNNVDTTGYVQDFLWIATAGRAAGDPGIRATWLFHQYGGGDTDLDYCRLGSAAELRSWATSFAQGSTTQEDDMPFSEQDIRRFVREEAAGQTVRDAIAYAVFWWLNGALTGDFPAGIPQDWTNMLQAAHDNLNAGNVAASVWNHSVPDWGIGPDGSAKALGTSKEAYWHLTWGGVFAAQQQAQDQRILAGQTAIASLADQLGQIHGVDTATVVAAVQKAITDATVHVQVAVTGTPAPAPAA